MSATRPNAQEIRKVATNAIGRLEKLGANADDLEKTLKDCARDGYPTTSDGPGTRNNISDPTFAAANGKDPARRAHEQLARLLDETDAVTAALMSLTDPWTRIAHNTTRKNNALTQCANIHGCPDNAWASERGRCPQCARHLRINGRDRTRAA